MCDKLEFGAKELQLGLREQTVHIIFAIFRPRSRGTWEHILIFKIRMLKIKHII